MIVRFEKHSERQYAISILRVDGEWLQMGQAPGFDRDLPHDLQHFIVEKGLDLNAGVFGQIAAGGTAGTFHLQDNSGSKREKSRRRRALKRKGQALARAGQSDAERSERAVVVCFYHWLKASDDPSMQQRALRMEQSVKSMLEGMAPDEREAYTPQKLEFIVSEMGRLCTEWHRTGIGESLEVVW